MIVEDQGFPSAPLDMKYDNNTIEQYHLNMDYNPLTITYLLLKDNKKLNSATKGLKAEAPTSAPVRRTYFLTEFFLAASIRCFVPR